MGAAGAHHLDLHALAQFAIDHAGESPSEELARALIASAALRIFRDEFTPALADVERAADIAMTVACHEVHIEALGWRAQVLLVMGRVTESLALREQGVAADRRAGRTDEGRAPTGCSHPAGIGTQSRLARRPSSRQ